MAARTRVSGTMTFQSEWDGREVTVRFPAFNATTETPYVDLVDEAIELVDEKLPKLVTGYSWLQIEEVIDEAEIATDPLSLTFRNVTGRELGTQG